MPNLLNRAERFQELVVDLQGKGDLHTSLGTDILSDLWEIYRDSLFQTEEYVYVTEDREVISKRFETFVEFCDEVIREHYDPVEYFDKFKWVVERVFRYLYIREQDEDPVLIPITNEPVTVEMLIQAKGWISKLIIISNKIEMCQTDEDIESLFFAGFNGTVDEVIQIGNDIQDQRNPIKIDYIERPLTNNNYNLLFNDINEEQYKFMLKKLGRSLVRHMD